MSGKVNLNGEIYEIIEIVNIGNYSYPIIKKGDDLGYLELIKKDDKIAYFLPNEDLSIEANQGKSLEHLNQNVLMNQFIEILRTEIKNGKYQSKEELIKRIKEIQQFISTDEKIQHFLKGSDCDMTLESFEKNLKGMLEYFDEYNKDVNLNLENVSTIETETGKYIKYESEDGIRILEDNVNDETVEEQFRAEQNEYASLQSSDGDLSTEQVFNSLEKHKKEQVTMSSLDSYDREDLTNEQVANNDLAESLTDNPFIKANPEHNLYIDNDGQVLTIEREGSEATINTVEEHSTTNSQEQQEVDSIDFGSLDDSDIYILLSEKRHLLTEEQIKLLEALQQQKGAQNDLNGMEKGKTKSLGEHPSTQNNQAAYTNLFILCTITWLFAFGMIIYIFINL